MNAQEAEIGPTILLHEEHVLAIIAALCVMTRVRGNDDSRDSWHGGQFNLRIAKVQNNR
jgi:hypothetical protein